MNYYTINSQHTLIASFSNFRHIHPPQWSSIPSSHFHDHPPRQLFWSIITSSPLYLLLALRFLIFLRIIAIFYSIRALTLMTQSSNSWHLEHQFRSSYDLLLELVALNALCLLINPSFLESGIPNSKCENHSSEVFLNRLFLNLKS